MLVHCVSKLTELTVDFRFHTGHYQTFTLLCPNNKRSVGSRYIKTLFDLYGRCTDDDRLASLFLLFRRISSFAAIIITRP